MNMIAKKINSLVIALLLIFPIMIGIGSINTLAAEDSITTSNSSAAYCIDTNQFLYEQNSTKIYAPGVTTKLMALMVAYDILMKNNIPLSKEISIDASWLKNCYVPGDRSTPYVGLAAGDIYSLEYLFTVTLMGNANDACSCIIHYITSTFVNGDSEFLSLMNSRAEELEMVNTRYFSTTGYNGGASTTTVQDVIKLAAAFYRYDTLVKMSDQYTYRYVKNKNYLICDKIVSGYLYIGTIGLIAGQATNDGNYAIVTYYEKDGLAYAFVVLGAPGEHVDADGTRWFDDDNAYTDIHKLIPWVLDSYKYTTICTSDDAVDELRVGEDSDGDHVILVPAETVEKLIYNPKKSEIQIEITYGESVFDSDFNGKTVKTVEAPVTKGTVFAKASYLLDGSVIAEVDLVARESVTSNALLIGLDSLKKFLFDSDSPMAKIVKIIVILIIVWIVLALAILIFKIVLKIKKKKKNGKSKNMNKM